MSGQVGLKEKFRRGEINATEALEKLIALGAERSKTGKWFTSRIAKGDIQRDPEQATKTREDNLEKNAPKEHNRKWRKGRGQFQLETLQANAEDSDEEE